QPSFEELLVQLLVGGGAGQDAGAVPAPGDVLPGVLPQLFNREPALVLGEGRVRPGDVWELSVHGPPRASVAVPRHSSQKGRWRNTPEDPLTSLASAAPCPPRRGRVLKGGGVVRVEQ